MGMGEQLSVGNQVGLKTQPGWMNSVGDDADMTSGSARGGALPNNGHHYQNLCTVVYT